MKFAASILVLTMSFPPQIFASTYLNCVSSLSSLGSGRPTSHSASEDEDLTGSSIMIPSIGVPTIGIPSIGLGPKLEFGGPTFSEKPGGLSSGPSLSPEENLELSTQVSALLGKGHKKEAAAICIKMAEGNGELKKGGLGTSLYLNKIGIDPIANMEKLRKEGPAIYRRASCNQNFQRDRCEELFINSLTNPDQALYGSTLLDSNGQVNKDSFNELAKALGVNDLPFNASPNSVASNPSSLKTTIIGKGSDPVDKFIKGLLIGDSSQKTLTALDKALSDEKSKNSEAAEIIGQPKIILLTMQIVQKIDQALADGNQSEADKYMKALEQVNPSAAKGLSCLLEGLPNNGLGEPKTHLSNGYSKVGPISGVDYNEVKNPKAIFPLVFVWIAANPIAAGLIVTSVIAIGVGIKNVGDFYNKSREINIAEKKLAIEQQKHQWEKEDREAAKLKEAEAKEKSDPKPNENVDPKPKATDPKGNIGTVHKDDTPAGPPKMEDIFGAEPPKGSGGSGGELLPPGSDEELAGIHKLQEDIEEAQNQSQSHYDPAQLERFCDDVVDDVKKTEIKAYSTSIHAVESTDVNDVDALKHNNVIMFDKWTARDEADAKLSGTVDKDLDTNCFVKDPVNF